eukprot:5929391-Prymnesium_polylepis.1
MADVFVLDAPLREVAARSISVRKTVCAEFLSGMPPFKKVQATAKETLMSFMTRTRLEAKPALGRLPGAAKEGKLHVRKSRGEGGRVLLEWREREHQLRVYSANKPISYRALNTVAVAGAQLHVEGLETKDLSKMTSRTAATEHDIQNHLIQRRCALESLGSSPSGLILQVRAGSPPAPRTQEL